MAKPSRGPWCVRCHAPIEEPARGGRPRIYCTVQCRRRAQRERDRARRGPGPSWQPIAYDLLLSSLQLHGCCQQLNLKHILTLAGHVARDAECLTAVAVDAALRRGERWQDIAAAAGVSQASARATWGGTRAQDLLAARVPPPVVPKVSGILPPGTAPRGAVAPCVPHPRTADEAVPGARQDLGVALRTLQKASGASLSQTATVTGLPLTVVTDMVAGRKVASWAETYTVAHALRGEPQDLVLLWERAAGEQLPVDKSSPDRLAAALRGAWLAAGAPSLALTSDVDVAVARAVLCGHVVPPWTVVSTLLTGLRADPALFEPLWVTARAAQLKSGEGRESP